MLKKLIYSLFLALFLLQIGGLAAFYTIQQTVQQTVQQIAMWEKLEKQDKSFSIIKISQLSFENSKKNEHEFVFNQKLFDIKSVKTQGDSVEIVAFQDSEEEAIIKKIIFLLDNDTPQSNTKLPQKLVDFLKFTAICPEYIALRVVFSFVAIKKCDFLPCFSFYKFKNLKFIEIPPEIIVF